MKKVGLNASTLRWILIGIILLLVGGGIFGAMNMQGVLVKQMDATNKIKIDAENSTSNLARAQLLKTYLETHKDDVDKTASIVADTVSYRYQDQVVQDITRYAQMSGLVILGFDFPVSRTTKPATSGLKPIVASITLDNPVNFRNYLAFIKLIEQNLTKMQITDITITPDKDNPNLINNPVIGLEVYIK